MRGCPRGGACGCLRAPAVSFGVFDYTTDPKGCQGGFVLMGFVSIDILRVLVVNYLFISVFSSYPQVIHRLSTGVFRVDLGQYGV